MLFISSHFKLVTPRRACFFYTLVVTLETLFGVCLIFAVRDREGVGKVSEWQSTYYGIDSGIQSGASTVRSDDHGTEIRKKYTYTTTVTENPAGKHDIHTYKLSKPIEGL